MGHWKNRWIQTPQRILMDPCIKQAPVLSKRFWIIPWPLAHNRLELDCIRKIINFWYTFGWKWRVFVTIYDCRTHVCMTSMTSSIERTDLNFKISVALIPPNWSIIHNGIHHSPKEMMLNDHVFRHREIGPCQKKKNTISEYFTQHIFFVHHKFKLLKILLLFFQIIWYQNHKQRNYSKEFI